MQGCEFIQVKAPQTRAEQSYIGMNHIRWNTVLACEEIGKSVLPISKLNTNVLRHTYKIRDPDCAVSWKVLMENISELHTRTNN